ncbi:MAG: hypothetical protein ACOVLB_08485 [Candidatus Nanopelagicus sp.]
MSTLTQSTVASMGYTGNGTTTSISLGNMSLANVSYTGGGGAGYGGGGGGGTNYGGYTIGSAGTWSTAAPGSVTISGDAVFEGNIKVKGKDLMKMLEQIEERLAILHPNLELEDRWEELKELSKRYRELEANILEKEKIIAILKQ